MEQVEEKIDPLLRSLEDAVRYRRKSGLPLIVCLLLGTLLWLFSGMEPARWLMARIHLYQYVYADGWIPPILRWIFWFVLVDLLCFKLFVRDLCEQRALKQFPLRRLVGDEGVGSIEFRRRVSDFSRNMGDSATERLFGQSYWLRRLSLGFLRLFKGDRKENIREALKVQAQSDEEASASSYLLVKVFIWATPLIGFIGTVEGISSGIADFSATLRAQSESTEVVTPALDSEGAGDSDKIADPTYKVKQGLMDVTSGLSRAFATTFSALMYTVILMLILTIAEKKEGERLNEIRDDVENLFVGAIPEAKRGDPGTVDTKEWGDLVSKTEAAAVRIEQARDDLKQFVDRAGNGIQVEMRFKPDERKDPGGQA